MKAIALRYRQTEDEAPVVLAKGQGLVAEAILELARAAQIPTVADGELGWGGSWRLDSPRSLPVNGGDFSVYLEIGRNS